MSGAALTRPPGTGRIRAVARLRPSIRARSVGVCSAGLCVVVAAMLAGSRSPLHALGIAAALPAVALLASSAKARLLAVLIGALLVFQGTSGELKSIYLAVAVLCFLISVLALLRSASADIVTVRPFIVGSLAMFSLVLVSAFVSHAHGIPFAAWEHIALTYVLLAALPVVGIDAGRTLSVVWVGRLIVLFGLLAALGFALDWLNRRGVSSLGVGRVLFGTTALAALGFSYALARAGTARRSWTWLVLAVVIAALLLVTGTRTNLVLLAAFVGVLGASSKLRVPLRRMIKLLASSAVLTAIVVPIIGRVAVSDPTFLTRRLAQALAVLTNGSASGDLSYQAREVQYQYARVVFDAHTLLGIGPGYIYPDGATILDTPWLFPATFGLLGVGVLAIYLLSVARCMRRTRALAGYSTVQTTARGWFAIVLALTPFGAWTEDKGVSLAVTLIMTGLVAHAHEAAPAATAGPRRVPPC